LYDQTNTIGAKILRNIKDTINNSNQLFISKDLKGLKIEEKNY